MLFIVTTPATLGICFFVFRVHTKKKRGASSDARFTASKALALAPFVETSNCEAPHR